MVDNNKNKVMDEKTWGILVTLLQNELEHLVENRGTSEGAEDEKLHDTKKALDFVMNLNVEKPIEKQEDTRDAEKAVHHPKHYNSYSREVIEVIDEWTSHFNGSTAYYLGNVLKYIARCTFKGKPIEDLEKANKYLEFAINRLESSKFFKLFGRGNSQKELHSDLKSASLYLEMALDNLENDQTGSPNGK